MAKERFNPNIVAQENKKKAIAQIQSGDSCVQRYRTDNDTIISVLATCIKLLNKFRELSANVDGPAIICHPHKSEAKRAFASNSKIYLRRDIRQDIEVRQHGMIFFEVLIKHLPQLKSCREQHRFMPLIQALFDVEQDFPAVASDMTNINGHPVVAVLYTINIEQWNLAIRSYQSTISSPEFIEAEQSFYASVRDMVDTRVKNLRKHTSVPDRRFYLSLVDLYLLDKPGLDSNTPRTFCYNQSKKIQFVQIVRAVEQWIEKLRHRKDPRNFEGVVVSFKYSEMKGWYGSAMLLFNYPETHTESLPACVYSNVDAAIDIWCTEINAMEGQDNNPVYPYALIHTTAFICPHLPVINSQNIGLYFFSANASEHNGNEALKLEQAKLKPIVDAFDYLFLSRCYMKYQPASEGPQKRTIRMLRSYRL